MSIAEDESFTCNFCDNTFDSKQNLMHHKKEEHTRKVNSCWHFSAGFCPFGKDKCWFAHITDNDIPLSNEYACKLCDKVCRSQADLLHHRRKKHENQVPSCDKFKNGRCIYGKENCWFVHNGQENIMEENNLEENKNVLQRIFKMMEKMTERIVMIETKKDKDENKNDEKDKDENEKEEKEKDEKKKDEKEKDKREKDKKKKMKTK